MVRQSLLLLCLLLLLCSFGSAEEGTLDRILKSGILRVGTTTDYRPFTFLESKRHEGYDIDVTRLIAKEFEVRIEFVPTTWANITSDLRAGKFDLAVGGITRTLKRQQSVGFTDPIYHIGKCPLVRRADRDRFTSLETIDQPQVRIGVNPGGTNERYVRGRFQKAKIIVVNDNLAIPEKVALGEVDVMLTDNVEALQAARRDPRLAAVSAEQPWTKETLAFMAPRDDQAFLNWLDLFIYQAEADGRLQVLRTKHGL